MDGVISLAARMKGNEAYRGAPAFAFHRAIDDICDLPWDKLDAAEVVQVAKAYYYFSVQFRENLEIACRLLPGDEKLQELRAGECATDNLSPWPGVAAAGERLDHDEFMRRALALQTVRDGKYLEQIGQAYLQQTRALPARVRATSIASYEDGGLTRVFGAMLQARDWQGPAARAFKFFLEQHILFDTDEDGGHGSLSRHLAPTDVILPLWIAFRELLVAAVPRFWQAPGALKRAARARSGLVAAAG